MPVGNAQGDLVTSWLNPTSIAIGVLAVATGAYLAAVYLAADAGAHRASRAGGGLPRAARSAPALVAGALAALAALVVVRCGRAAALARAHERLRASPRSSPRPLAGVATLALVARRRFEAARVTRGARASPRVVAGWALAQRPELLPGLTVDEAAAGRSTLVAVIVAAAIGARRPRPVARAPLRALPARARSTSAPLSRAPCPGRRRRRRSRR